MPEQLHFPQQATHEHLDKAAYWKADACFTIEFATIRSHCTDQAANDAAARHPMNWLGVWNQIEGAAYTTPPQVIPGNKLIQAANNGSVEQQAPGDGTVLGWASAVWAGFLLEVLVFALQMLVSGEWSPPLLVLAVVLGGGGVLMGMGLGDMLFASWLKGWLKETQQMLAGNEAKARLALLVTGAAVVGGAVFVRAMGTPYRARLKAVLVTLALGLMVAAFEMMAVYSSKKRKRLMSDMSRVQRNFAYQQHRASQAAYQQAYEAHYQKVLQQGPHAAALASEPAGEA